MFLQVPLPHGCLSHSSMSGSNQGKGVTVGRRRPPGGPRRRPLTHAHALVSSGLEAVVAETAIAALRVDALAVAAHVRDVLALVPI